MFINCPNCRALVATDPATDEPPERCPRCAAPLRLTAAIPGASAEPAPAAEPPPPRDTRADDRAQGPRDAGLDTEHDHRSPAEPAPASASPTAPVDAAPSSPAQRPDTPASGGDATDAGPPVRRSLAALLRSARRDRTAATSASPASTRETIAGDADTGSGRDDQAGSAPSATSERSSPSVIGDDAGWMGSESTLESTLESEPASATESTSASASASEPAPASPASRRAPSSDPVRAASGTPQADAARVVAKPAPSFVRATDTATRTGWMSIAAIAGLALALVLQLLLADRARLAADAQWRPWMSALCGAFGCHLPPWQEPDAFTLLARDVQPHPAKPGVLRVTATFRNDARGAQPWPRLRLTLSDVDGNAVAAREFTPRDYLGAVPTQAELGSGQSTTIAMDVVEPNARSVAFDFALR